MKEHTNSHPTVLPITTLPLVLSPDSSGPGLVPRPHPALVSSPDLIRPWSRPQTSSGPGLVPRPHPALVSSPDLIRPWSRPQTSSGPGLVPRPHPALVSSPDLIRGVYHSTCNTESDPHWGWFWVWNQDYTLPSSQHTPSSNTHPHNIHPLRDYRISHSVLNPLNDYIWL